MKKFLDKFTGKKDRLIPRKIITNGLLSTILLAIGGAKAVVKEKLLTILIDSLAEEKIALVEQFGKTDEFSDILIARIEDLESNRNITPGEREKELKYLYSQEFKESVITATKNTEILEKLNNIVDEYAEYSAELEELQSSEEFIFVGNTLDYISNLLFGKSWLLDEDNENTRNPKRNKKTDQKSLDDLSDDGEISPVKELLNG